MNDVIADTHALPAQADSATQTSEQLEGRGTLIH